MSEDMAKIHDQLKIMAPAQEEMLAELTRMADAQERTAAVMEEFIQVIRIADLKGFFNRPPM